MTNLELDVGHRVQEYVPKPGKTRSQTDVHTVEQTVVGKLHTVA